MALTNNLRKQVDLPVWEWCRLAPAVSSPVSATCTADNSLYHVSFGRYIYYLQAAATLATTSGLTGFFRYDTISDSYQLLAQPPLTPTIYTGLQFAGGQGFFGYVLGNGGGLNTLQIPGMTGQTFKGFDIRIIGGTGNGQQRIITGASDPVIWDNGTVSAVAATPQGNITDANKNWALNQWAGYQVRYVSTVGQSQARKILYNSSNTLYFADVAKFAEDPWAWSPVVQPAGSAEAIASAAAGSQTMYQIESSVITVDTNWTVVPDATSRFVIRGGGIWMITQGATYALQYYDILADQWYIRNAGAATSPVMAIGTDGTIVNSGENATVWDRGAATGSQSTTTLQDTTKSWATNQWAGYRVRIFSGTGEDQYRTITSNTGNTLTVPAWTTITPDTTTKYFIEAFEMGTLSSINPVLPAAAAAAICTAGVSGTPNITTSLVTPMNCNGWYISGTGITPGTTISSGQGTKNLVLSGNNASTVSGMLILSPVAISATAASGVINTFVITTGSAVPANSNGWYISGTGIGLGARIVSGQGTTSLTLSVPNTATVSGTLYVYPTAPIPNVFSTSATGSGSSTTVTTTLTTPNNCNGWYATGTGIAINAIVTAGQGTTSLTLSIANAGAVSGIVTLSPTIAAGTASSGVNGASTIVMADNTPPFCNGWYISGTGIGSGATIVSGQGTTSLTLSVPNTATVSGTLSLSATPVTLGTINGSVFTAGTTTGVYYPGQVLFGTGIQSTRTILSPPADCSSVSASTTISFASGNPITLGIQVGMVVSINSIVGLPNQGGAGILLAGNQMIVTAVASSSVTVNVAPSTAFVNATLQFTTAWATSVAAHTNVGNIVTLIGGSTTVGLYPGMYISAGAFTTGTIIVGTYVAQVIDSTHFSVSQAISPAFTGSGWILAQGYHTTIVNQLSGPVGGAGTYTVFPSQMVTNASIIGTGVSIVTDTTKAWANNRWNNYAIRIKAGTGMGQVRQILDTGNNGVIAYTSAAGATSVGSVITVGSTTNLAVNHVLTVTAGVGSFAFGTFVQSITDATHFIASAAPTVALSGGATVITGVANNTLKVYPAWSTPPDATSVYAIHGDSDKNYFSTAGQTPTFIHNIEADMPTTGRQLERGVARGVSAQYSDYEPVALASGVPVLPVTGGYGYIAGVAVLSGSTTSNVATILYSTAVASSIFPVGSWITMAGQTPANYVGTWQVIASSVGSVSFYLTGAPGILTVFGTVGQAASLTLSVGTLSSGSWLQIGNAMGITVAGCVPSTFNGALTVAANVGGGTSATFGGYQSAAGATSSGTTITVGNTVGLVAGAIPTITAGVGTFAAGTYVVSITNATTFVINTAPTVALSGGATIITVVPSVAVTSTIAIGNLVTYGVVQVNPKASTLLSGSAGTVTLTTAATVFPVGSWIVVTGAAPTTYNGVYQVTGGTPGSTVQYANASTAAVTTQAFVGPATVTQLVTTVNSHIFQTGYTISHKGDQGFTAATNNITASITVMTPAVGTAATQYIYTVGVPAAQMFVYGQTTTTLCDATKNWIPNQWAGAQVTYNSTQFTIASVQPTILTAYVLANTSNTLIFAAAHATAPLQGVSRYVITTPATMAVGNTVGSQDSGLVQGAQLITQLQDVTKSWIMPAPITGITGTTITVGSATVVITGSLNGILPGMTVAITLGGVTLPLGTTVVSIVGTTMTVSNNFGGAGTTATFTFAATATSSGNVVTVTGYPLTNLTPGMKLAVTSATNMSSLVLSTGAFVQNGGVNFTPVTVVSITGPNTFTISQTPTVPLLNATVQATFWVPNQWVGRRMRITSGITISNSTLCETIITANTTNTLTFLTITTSPTHGTNGYAIMQQPLLRGLGTALLWNFGASNANTIGRYLYQARGGNLPGFDRINLQTDKWEFMTATPSYETFNTGAMYAYDGADRIYFTVQVTQRVYYLDIESNVIHPAGMYPYVAGVAIVGNRMEIFETADGLRYLWLNRHSFQECFRQLLWY